MGIKSYVKEDAIKKKPINDPITLNVYRCYNNSTSWRVKIYYYYITTPGKYENIEKLSITLSYAEYLALTPGTIARGLSAAAEHLWTQAYYQEMEKQEEAEKEKNRKAWETIGQQFWKE